MIFETHAHFDDDAFNEDRDILLKSLAENGIGTVVNVGASLASTRTTIELSEKYPFVYGAVGVHPSEVAELNEDNFAWLKKQCDRKKIVAVGEIGLDYYWPEPEHELQKKWFGRQIELAKEVKLPIIIHSRDAAQDTIEVMKQYQADEVGGIVHCYSYSKELTDTFLDMGFYFGIGGVVTFKNSKKLKEAVEYLPIEKIVLETDSPYLTPEPNRGKRNSSLNLPYIAQAVADLKGMTYDEVVAVTEENAKKLFRM